MQVCGSFPYRMTATSGPPTFNTPLFLFGIFEQVLLVAMNSMALHIMFLGHLKEDIGTDSFIFSVIVMIVALCSYPVIMTIKSSSLATLLHDMSGIEGVSPPPSHRWYCQPYTLIVLLIVSMFTVVYPWSSARLMGLSHFADIATLMFVSFLCVLYFLLPVELPSMVFGLLGRRLVAATEDAVATISMLLTPDGSFKRTTDLEAAMLALRDLDVVIHKVRGYSAALYVSSNKLTPILCGWRHC